MKFNTSQIIKYLDRQCIIHGWWDFEYIKDSDGGNINLNLNYHIIYGVYDFIQI